MFANEGLAQAVASSPSILSAIVSINNTTEFSVTVQTVLGKIVIPPNTLQDVAVSPANPFTVQVNTFTPTYTIPLNCGNATQAINNGDLTNVCSFANNSVWTFKAPLYQNGIPVAHAVGSISATGGYNLFIGMNTITVDLSTISNLGISVFFNTSDTTLTKVNMLTNIIANSNWNSNPTNPSSSSSLNGLPFSFQFKNVFYRSTQEPKTVFYAERDFSSKAFLSITPVVANTTITLVCTLNPEHGNLGFTFEAANYPPIITTGDKITLGFYSTDLDRYTTFAPQAPFQFTNLASSKLPSLSYSFMQCPLTGYLILCQIDGDGNAIPALVEILTNGTAALTFPLSTGATSPSQLMSLTCEQNGQWGIFQTWDGGAFSVNAFIVIAYRNIATGITYYLNGSTDPKSGVVTLGLTITNGVTTSNPPGFINNILSGFFMTIAPVAPLPTGYDQYCWVGSPPLAAQFIAKNNNYCQVTGTQTQNGLLGRKEYITSVCASSQNENCRSIAGFTPNACSGWLSDDTAAACELACSSTFGPYCNEIKIAYCNSSPERYNSGDCACINAKSSSFKVPLRGNRSFPGFQQYLSTEYGIEANTDLQPECWWDTCATNDGGLVLFGQNAVCPNKLNQCTVSLQNLKVDAASSINIEISNNCQIASSKTGTNNPCSSLQKYLNGSVGNNNNNNNDNGDDVPAPRFNPDAYRLVDYIAVGLSGTVLFILVVLTFVYIIKKKLKQPAND